ncbi:MAG: TIGR04211 family SH3 domain-containing protein [Gammaproteobacteria bacterium]|nr:TIGR04211 family SH3 domain-containing protein [Gammaproteobacteria bacterium]MDH4254719.1 TIGR04211 family SH3 domain-containing protein [Gammaproteobacteria bacterium]
MNERLIGSALAALLCSLFFGSPVLAETAWVSDQFEITLRSGPSTSNAIQLMINSGTALEVLERDPETGYSKVRTQGGTEGWVLTRYLMNEPSAREQLESLSAQVSSATERGTSLGSQLNAIRSEYQEATNRIRSLEREKEQLQADLDEIKRTAANVLGIDSQNKSLQRQLTDTEIQVSILEEENRQLKAQSNRTWFLTGAGVLFGGVLLGLILPRMRWQRRSRYDSF